MTFWELTIMVVGIMGSGIVALQQRQVRFNPHPPKQMGALNRTISEPPSSFDPQVNVSLLSR